MEHHKNLTLNARALQQHRSGHYSDAIAIYNDVIASETALCRADTSSRRFDERFLMNRGDAYYAVADLAEVRCTPPPCLLT